MKSAEVGTCPPKLRLLLLPSLTVLMAAFTDTCSLPLPVGGTGDMGGPRHSSVHLEPPDRLTQHSARFTQSDMSSRDIQEVYDCQR
jgi:hypothetical protein